MFELDRRTTLQKWREWKDVYRLDDPLLTATRFVTTNSVLQQLHDVRTSLCGRRALEEYEEQSGEGLIVLCVDALVGWTCRSPSTPRLDTLDLNLVVTPDDFAWTFGIQESWRGGLSHGGPVFLDRARFEKAFGFDPNASAARDDED